MNYSEHSILDNPYWRQLVVRENFPYEIPGLTMMEESILQPKLDRDFAVKILNQYEIEDITEIEKILKQNNPDTLWKKITEELSIEINGEHKYNPKLYTFFSLQNYRLTQTTDHISYRRSDSIFRGWSNLVISNMINAPENQYLKNFCRTKIILPNRDISYEHIRFHINVLTYCRNVFPRPLCYPQSHTSDHQSMQQFAEKVKEQFTNPDLDIPFQTISDIPENITKDKIKALVRKQQRELAYPRQIEETDRRLDIRFVERCASRKWLEKIQLEYHIDLSKYTESRLSNHVENIERDEKKRRDKNKNNSLRKRLIQEIADLPGKKDEELHQCQFCYKYRIEKPKSTPQWHCGEEICKSAYQGWLDDLRKNGIELEALRLMGF